MGKKNQDFRLVDTRFQQLEKREGSGQRNWYLGKILGKNALWFSTVGISFRI